MFDDLRLVLTEKVAKADKLTRYIVAFGGEVLPAYQRSTATHVVYPKGPSINDVMQIFQIF